MCVYVYIYIYLYIYKQLCPGGKKDVKRTCFQEITSALEIPLLREGAWGDWYSTTPAIVH